MSEKYMGTHIGGDLSERALADEAGRVYSAIAGLFPLQISAPLLPGGKNLVWNVGVSVDKIWSEEVHKDAQTPFQLITPDIATAIEVEEQEERFEECQHLTLYGSTTVDDCMQFLPKTNDWRWEKIFGGKKVTFRKELVLLYPAQRAAFDLGEEMLGTDLKRSLRGEEYLLLSVRESDLFDIFPGKTPYLHGIEQRLLTVQRNQRSPLKAWDARGQRLLETLVAEAPKEIVAYRFDIGRSEAIAEEKCMQEAQEEDYRYNVQRSFFLTPAEIRAGALEKKCKGLVPHETLLLRSDVLTNNGVAHLPLIYQNGAFRFWDGEKSKHMENYVVYLRERVSAFKDRLLLADTGRGMQFYGLELLSSEQFNVFLEQYMRTLPWTGEEEQLIPPAIARFKEQGYSTVRLTPTEDLLTQPEFAEMRGPFREIVTVESPERFSSVWQGLVTLGAEPKIELPRADFLRETIPNITSIYGLVIEETIIAEGKKIRAVLPYAFESRKFCRVPECIPFETSVFVSPHLGTINVSATRINGRESHEIHWIATLAPHHHVALMGGQHSKKRFVDHEKYVQLFQQNGYRVYEDDREYEGSEIGLLKALRDPQLLTNAFDARAEQIVTTILGAFPPETEYSFVTYELTRKRAAQEEVSGNLTPDEILARTKEQFYLSSADIREGALERICKSLSVKDALGITSSVVIEGKHYHLPMIDFAPGYDPLLPRDDKARELAQWSSSPLEKIRTVFGKLQMPGMIVASGDSAHGYGLRLLDPPEWKQFMRSLNRYSELSRHIDTNWANIQQKAEYATLRLTPAAAKLTQPTFVEKYVPS